VVDDLEWAHAREKILKQINESNKKVGFDAWVSESHNTYLEDAMKCYNRHRRPEHCIDFMSDSKRIGRPTAVGRLALKENRKQAAGDPHLCDWCPCKSGVQTELNKRAGLYDG
jgi:hypothetical protein